MNENLISLADACLEVHKSSADHREARANFRQIIQKAYDMGKGIQTDPVVGTRAPNPPQPAVKAAITAATPTVKPAVVTRKANEPKPASSAALAAAAKPQAVTAATAPSSDKPETSTPEPKSDGEFD